MVFYPDGRESDMEAGGWRLEAGGWRLEAGECAS